MDRPQAQELADHLHAQGWTSAHVVETGRDDYRVKVIIPAYDRYDERVILVDAYQAFGGAMQGWSATAYDDDAIEPTETLVTYDERGVIDMLAALRARQLDGSRSVVGIDFSGETPSFVVDESMRPGFYDPRDEIDAEWCENVERGISPRLCRCDIHRVDEDES